MACKRNVVAPGLRVFGVGSANLRTRLEGEAILPIASSTERPEANRIRWRRCRRPYPNRTRERHTARMVRERTNGIRARPFLVRGGGRERQCGRRRPERLRALRLER
jgi:hypothetical protein